MTQPPRTTETANRDNAAIRDIMHRIRALTVPDRATVALGLVGHLATLMNERQMKKLMTELEEEAERVQNVPVSRRRIDPPDARPGRSDSPEARPNRSGPAERGVGQAGRGEFRAGRPV